MIKVSSSSIRFGVKGAKGVVTNADGTQESYSVDKGEPIIRGPIISEDGESASFGLSQGIIAEGLVTFDGQTGDAAEGWSAGFIQIQANETNWALYRGETRSDGSVFLELDRPPARPVAACRDTERAGQTFYTRTDLRSAVRGGTGFPATVSVIFSDNPHDEFSTTIKNSAGKTLYLREASCGIDFHTVLSVQDPAGTITHLKSFQWHVRWHAVFSLDKRKKLAAASGSEGCRAWVGKVIDGPPADKKLAALLTGEARNCNEIAWAATNRFATNPRSENWHESSTWTIPEFEARFTKRR